MKLSDEERARRRAGAGKASAAASEARKKKAEAEEAAQAAPPEEDLDELTKARANARRAEKLLAERSNYSEALADYANLLKDCFAAGSKAASEQRTELVELVKVVSQNFATSITTLHNAAIELAQERARGPEESLQDKQQMALLSQIVANTAAHKTNGKPPGKEKKS